METIDRFFQIPGQSCFIFGPRGTGKSTWLKQHCPDAIYIDLLSPETYRLFTARPERLRELVEGSPSKNIVIIDEIQRVSELLPAVHQLIESSKTRLFILTGSSARKLKRAEVDLLAGRALVTTMHPFMAAELGRSFQLNQALQIGLLPLVLDASDPQATLNAYASLYLHEEVQMEGLVRNIGNFARFLEVISFSHGAVLNTSQVARDCQVGRKTVEGYIEILEDLLLAYRLPVFTKRAKRHLQSHPKFYFFDTGVFQSLRPKGPLDAPESIGGPALEGLVAQHLQAWNAYSGTSCDMYYWRTKSKVEVDFVLYGPDTFLAIEVKNARHVRSQDLQGLKSFHEDYPECQPVLLYRGTERLKNGPVLCIPCEEFLQGLVPRRPVNVDE